MYDVRGENCRTIKEQVQQGTILMVTYKNAISVYVFCVNYDVRSVIVFITNKVPSEACL